MAWIYGGKLHERQSPSEEIELVDVEKMLSTLQIDDPHGMMEARTWAAEEGRRLLSAAVNNGWQPISTAPKNGARMFHLTERGRLLTDVYWIPSGYMPRKDCPGGLEEFKGTWSNYRLSDPATHWHPLGKLRNPDEHG